MQEIDSCATAIFVAVQAQNAATRPFTLFK